MQHPEISSFLWFDANAQEAVQLYKSVFGEHIKVSGTNFELFGQRFIAFNGGPHHKLSEAFSIMVSCDTQAEIDRYWEALLQGGGEMSRCGWLKDRFGVSWQIVPKKLFSLLNNPDREKAGRALQAMLGMQKLDLAKLENA
ncbi:MAG TPA: VOC family protein [Polyangiales bacterium]|nr:VOC family protein [Polyangiales bacterium]